MFLLFWLNILTIIYRMEFILSRNVINFYCNMQEKMKLDNYYPNIIIETIFTYTENNKANESRKFVLYLSQRLDLKSTNKHFALQNLCIRYTWKNVKHHYKNNKLRNNSSNVK